MLAKLSDHYLWWNLFMFQQSSQTMFQSTNGSLCAPLVKSITHRDIQSSRRGGMKRDDFTGLRVFLATRNMIETLTKLGWFSISGKGPYNFHLGFNFSPTPGPWLVVIKRRKLDSYFSNVCKETNARVGLSKNFSMNSTCCYQFSWLQVLRTPYHCISKPIKAFCSACLSNFKS